LQILNTTNKTSEIVLVLQKKLLKL
jgi:hypothetical protein